jgi:digeranylgeranylglycerophospholipid reductase
MPHSNSYEADIVIIGAGIAGSYTANLLAQSGYKTFVLEKNEESGHKVSCTGIISRECLDLLPDTGKAVQFQAHSAIICSPAGNCLHIDRDSPQAYVLDRAALDRLVAGQAENNGARFFFTSSVTEIHSGHDSVQIVAVHRQMRQVFKAKAVIIASGAGTPLTRAVGLGEINEFARGAQAEVACPSLKEVEIYSGTDIAPGFFAWMVPTIGDSAKVGLLSCKNAKPYITHFLNTLQQKGRITQATHKVNYSIIPLTPLARTYCQRLLVIGDAAGQVKPTTGGGIFFGILSARQAVQTLKEAMESNDYSAKKLSSYQRRWHKILKQELSIDYWAHKFYKGLSNSQIDHIFNIIEKHAIHESILASPDITFDWHGKVILDALKYRSLQRSLEKMRNTVKILEKIKRK